MINKKFGRWFVLKEIKERTGSGDIIYKCKCDCGKKRNVPGCRLRNGKSKSCGCLAKEVARKLMIKHGIAHTFEYKLWKRICHRCERVKKYTDRGIKCFFSSFDSFLICLKKLGPRPEGYSLDRINNDGHYEDGNIRWASAKQQVLNRNIFKKKTSKYRGVSWNKEYKKWRAEITINDIGFHLGRFDNEEDAYKAFLEKYFLTYKAFPPEMKMRVFSPTLK